MEQALSDLEGKLDELIALVDALRAENRELRVGASTLEAERDRLAQRMGAARTRLEALAERLPA